MIYTVENIYKEYILLSFLFFFFYKILFGLSVLSREVSALYFRGVSEMNFNLKINLYLIVFELRFLKIN